MSEDYLWDRTGEADSELLRLEQTLGTLRHRPTTLALSPRAQPPAVIIPRRPHLRPALALAASLIFLCGLGWFLTHTIRQQRESGAPATADGSDVNRHPPQPISPPAQNPAQNIAAINDTPRRSPATAEIIPARRETPVKRLRRRALPIHRTSPLVPSADLREVALSPSEREQGVAAKEKLMLALRIAGLELRDVRRRIYAESSSADANNK